VAKKTETKAAPIPETGLGARVRRLENAVGALISGHAHVAEQHLCADPAKKAAEEKARKKAEAAKLRKQLAELETEDDE
jgi:hypothetical protein